MMAKATEFQSPALRALAIIAAVAPVGFAGAQGLGPPDGPGTGNCLTSGCHAPLAQGPVVHGVMELDACDICHESTGSGHGFRSPDPIGSTCVACHADPADASGHVHGPVASGHCTSCHDPHRSDHPALLLEESGPLCWKCHSTPVRVESGTPVRAVKAEIEESELVHGAVELGCDTCHPPHASELAGLFTDDFPTGPYARSHEGAYELCFGCHDASLISANDAMATGFRDGDLNLHAAHVARPKSRSCSICHSSHAGGPYLIRESSPFGNWDLPVGFEQRAGGGRCATACHEAREYLRDPSVPKSPAPTSE